MSLGHAADSPRDLVGFGSPGLLRVHAHNAAASDLAAVTRDVGPPGAPGVEPPDVTIHFVDELPYGPLPLVDGGSTGYGDDGLYFLDASGRGALARVRQGERWGQASITCRRGLRRIPFLSAAADFAALSRGWAPLHASAWVTKEGLGVVVSGWANSGKTGLFLAACERGATPIGDDRIFLSRDGSRMVGLGRPTVVKDWHLAQLRIPALGDIRGRRTLARIAVGMGVPLEHAVSKWSRLPGKGLRRVRGALGVEVDLCGPAGLSGMPHAARPAVLIILETHRHASIVSEAVEPLDAASRVAAHVGAELMPTLRTQLSFTYAFPGRGWKDVGRAPEVVEDILSDAIRGMPIYRVRHPYPCSLEQLAGVVADLVPSKR